MPRNTKTKVIKKTEWRQLPFRPRSDSDSQTDFSVDRRHQQLPSDLPETRPARGRDWGEPWVSLPSGAVLAWTSAVAVSCLAWQFVASFSQSQAIRTATIIQSLITAAAWIAFAFSNPGYLSEDQQGEKTELCQYCRLWRLPRTVHCRWCDRCVGGYDHHCGVLNKCVGRGNLPLFKVVLGLTLCHFAVGFGLICFLSMSH